MLQRLFSVLLLVLSLLLSAWIYLNLAKPHIDHIDPMSIVPSDADLVARLNTTDWTEFARSSVLLAEMLPEGTGYLKSLIQSLDSARKGKDALQHLLNESALTVAVIQEGDQSDWALLFQIDADMHEQGNWGMALGLSDQPLAPIKSTVGENGYYVLGNTVCVSNNLSLFQPNFKGELLVADSLYQVLANSWGSSPLNLALSNKGTAKKPQSYDLLFSDGVMKFIGYEHEDESQEPAAKVNPVHVVGLGMRLPDAATEITGWIGNGGSYAKDKLASLRKAGGLAEFNQNLSTLELTCECDAADLLMDNLQSWAHYSSKNNGGRVLGFSGLQGRFDEYNQLLGLDFSDYKGYPVFTIADWSVLEELLEAKDKITHVTIAGEYMIATSSLEELQWYINEMVADRIYGYSAEASILQSEFIPRESSFFVGEKWKTTAFLPWPTSIKSAFTVQQACKAENGVYNSIALHGNQQKSSASVSGWRCTLDHTISAAPSLVRNHHTGSKEVFIQDDGLVLHLIDETGKELWQKKINQKIRSKIRQVDLYKNGKLQLIFNTQSQIICLDRNGKNAPGFPIDLASRATSELAVFDYDANRDYRLAIACVNGEIYNYRHDGSSTRGWKYKSSGTPVISMNHLKIKGKDYIFALEDQGNIHLLKRNGKSRYDSKAVAEHYSGNGYYFIKGSNIQTTKLIYPDTLGNIILSQFDKHNPEQSLTGFSSGSTIVVGDITGDNKDDFVIVDGRDLTVYDDEFNRIFRKHHENDLIPEARIYRFSSVDRKIGVSIAGSDEILLYNISGEIEAGFPKKGNGPFTIGDLNGDGKLEAVVALKHGEVVSYPLD
ncbi:MAG: hypothetical protein ACI84C_000249 [Flavobacteriales bacterium]|jgi:hypothetical protein